MKKIICLCLIMATFTVGVFSKEMKDISATEVTKLMGTGWNLGNTLDAVAGRGLGSETSWGQPKTTKQMIDNLSASGMKTIRIPVSWSNHIIDNAGTIDPAWMARVKEIVDWAIADDMYVILNCHHDNAETPNGLTANKGYYPSSKGLKESVKFVKRTWTQIAKTFNNDYDEHLIFETLNEPRLRNTGVEWTYSSNDSDCKDSMNVLNKLNQTAVDAIRASGGNNAKRFIMCPSYAAAPEAALNSDFKMPADKAKEKLILSVHMYTPYSFAGQAPGARTYTPAIQNSFAAMFKKLNTNFVQNGIGVVIGEYGAVNKNNLEDRVKWFTNYIKYSQQNNLPAVLWDNGAWRVPNGTTEYSEKFGYYNRLKGDWYFPEILEAIMSEVK